MITSLHAPVAQLDRASGFEPSPVFSTTYRHYIKLKELEGKNPNSYGTLKTVWLEALKDRPLQEITSQELTDHLERVSKERKYSKQTWNVSVAALSGFFRWAKTMGYVRENPVSEGRVPRVTRLQNDRRFVLGKDQFKKLIDALEWTPEIQDFVVCAAKTGLRFSKLAEIRPHDIRQDEQGTDFLEVLDKNGDTHRIYLFGEVRHILQKRREQAIKEGREWVLCGPEGGKMRQKYLRTHMVPAARIAGIDWGRGRYQFSFHSLRRMFASTLLNSGASIEEVMEAGNWRSYEIVKRYAIMNSEKKKASFRKMDKIL